VRNLKRAFALAIIVGTLSLPAFASASDNTPIVPDLNLDAQRHRRERDYDPTDFGVEARQRFPFFVSLGAYFPTFSGDGTSNSTGAELAFGYRFPTDNLDFRVSVRGQEFNITDSFGNQSTIDVSEFSFDALFRLQQFYAGPGISFGSVTGTTNGFSVSGSNQTVFSLTAGYDTYKGISLNFGLRF